MKPTVRLSVFVSIVAPAYAGGAGLAACSGGTAVSDAGPDGTAGDSGGKKDAGQQQDTGTPADAGNDDVAQAQPLDLLCTAPVDAATNGSCVTLDDASFTCNPVTNQGCDAGAGETCDFSNKGNFVCFPAPNDVALCGSCNNTSGPFCKPTLHCTTTDAGFGCGRWCCDDTDCTGGHCDLSTLGGKTPGICVK